jgi:hypothetical protein
LVCRDDSAAPRVEPPRLDADRLALRVKGDAARREDAVHEPDHPEGMAGHDRRGIGENVNLCGCRWAAAREPVMQRESEFHATCAASNVADDLDVTVAAAKEKELLHGLW